MIAVENLTLNRIFPNLRRFTLIVDYPMNYNFTYCELSHLKHFEIRTFDSYENLVGFFQKNPQIISFKVFRLNPLLCELINDHLTNLQNLTINTNYLGIDEEITIEHVKHLKTTGYYFNYMNRLNFPNLESLDIENSEIYHDHLTQFYIKHRNITRLKIRGFSNKNDLTFKHQMNELQNLNEITFVHLESENLDAISLSELIETHQGLVKINLLKIHLTEDQLTKFQDDFKNDLNMAVNRFIINGKHFVNLTFEKRK